jgi:hypothetical protein
MHLILSVASAFVMATASGGQLQSDTTTCRSPGEVTLAALARYFTAATAAPYRTVNSLSTLPQGTHAVAVTDESVCTALAAKADSIVGSGASWIGYWAEHSYRSETSAIGPYYVVTLAIETPASGRDSPGAIDLYFDSTTLAPVPVRAPIIR